LEKWEQGFNSIILPDGAQAFDAERCGEVAALLNLSSEDVRRILEAAMPLPIARPATADEALLVERRLAELGLRVLTVSDDELAIAAQPPKRIRALELSERALVAWPTGSNETLRASWDDVSLLLSGRMMTRHVEVEERHRRKTEKQIIETRELSSDSALLDIYTQTHEGGWRIVAGNFDFSCLVEKKSLLVAQNFVTLLEELRVRAVRAEYDDSYGRLRHALGIVWPFEQQTEARGIKRGGPGGRVRTEAVTTSDNERQFTRYSRLRYYLKTRRTDVNS
jgi:hypothetical protein